MHRAYAGLCAAVVLVAVAPSLHAEDLPGLPVQVDVSHVGKDRWRVDYRFPQGVNQVMLPTVGDYRQKSWKVLTPRMRLKTEGGADIIAADGKAFKTFSVEVSTYATLIEKQYVPFTRFGDGGAAMYLGHLQGDAKRGKQTYEMKADIKLNGLPGENVVAPPRNRHVEGGPRGYAYFGAAQPVRSGTTLFLIDPHTPDWARETLIDTGARMAAYYEKAYQRPLKEDLFIMASMAGVEAPGISLNGGAVMGQLAYRFEGKQMLGDNPKKRELLARIVAHEMAHIWQLNIARGGVGEGEPWVHEGGAEAMALDGLLQTGILSAEKVAAYRTAQTAICDKLEQSLASYEGIYACGLVRFDKLGVDIVPLWRAMMQASESEGKVYSARMIEAVVAGKAGAAAARAGKPAAPASASPGT